MQPNNYDQFKDFVNKDEFKWYVGKLIEQAESYEAMADRPDITDSEKLHYFIKGRTIREIINLPQQWLKEKN